MLATTRYDMADDKGRLDATGLDRVSASSARRQLSTLLGRVESGKEAIGITRHGRTVAVLIPVEAYAILLDAEDELLAARALDR